MSTGIPSRGRWAGVLACSAGWVSMGWALWSLGPSNVGAVCLARLAMSSTGGGAACAAVDHPGSDERSQRIAAHLKYERGETAAAAEAFERLAASGARRALDRYDAALAEASLNHDLLESAGSDDRGVSSQHLVWESARLRAMGRVTQADGAARLAFRVDRGWSDQMYRALNARDLAQASQRRGDRSTAEAAWRRAIESYRRTGARGLEGLAASCWALGQSRESRGDADGALAAYIDGIRASPAHSLPSYLSLVSLLGRRGSNAQAIQRVLLDLTDDSRPAGIYTYAWPANALWRAGAFAAAESLLRRAPAAWQTRSLTLIMYARLDLSRDQLARARDRYEAARAAASTDRLVAVDAVEAEMARRLGPRGDVQ